MTSRTRLLAILISAPIIAFVIIGGFLGNVMARTDDTYAHLRVFQDVVSLIMSNTQRRKDRRRLIGFVSGVVTLLGSFGTGLLLLAMNSVRS